jgi:hypothetical protein
MKKNLLSLFILLSFYSSSFSQEGLYQFSKSYFRSDPFIGEFSVFLKHLMNDPAITNKRTLHRTDSRLFSFSGVFNNYNPFFYKPKRIEIVLEESAIQYADSIPPDTILVYQLIAYADNSIKAEQEVKKEFAKIHRQFHKKFYNSNYQDLKTREEITGGVHNYFVAVSGLAPVSVVWGKLKESNESVLNIILRIKKNGNKTVLAAPPYNP